MMKSTISILLLYCCTPYLQAQSGLEVFDDSYVHEIRVYFDQPNFWEILSLNYNFDLDNDPTTLNTPLMAQVKLDGNEIDSVAVNQKGFYSNWGAAESLKKPIKLDFNEFAPDQEYDNLKSLNLQNAFMDPSLMRDMLSYRILRDFGVAAPRTAYAKVYLNDTYWGLYVMVESVNKTFLKEHFGDNDGNLYKAEFTSFQYLGADPSSYLMDFDLKTNENTNDWSRLIHLIDLINNTPNSKFRDSLSAYLDLESYLKTLAVDVTIHNWDAHFDHGRNFYIYDNPSDGKFYWIPWDYNLAFANLNTPYDITISELRNGFDYDKVLPRRVLGNALLQEQYLEIVCALHQDVFTPGHLNPIIYQKEALIVDALEEDPNKFYPDIEDFHISLTDGFENLIVDSFPFIDSSWNGTMWVVIDTVFVFEYLEIVPGLKSMIAQRNEIIQLELKEVYEVSCTSPVTEPIASQKLEIWPNPSDNWFNIKAPEPDCTLSIYDIHGRLLKRGQVDTAEIAISMQGYQPGVYWVEIISRKERNRAKIVVAR